MTDYYLDGGVLLPLGAEVAKGGEGAVFVVPSKPTQVAKIWFDATDERIVKVAAMLSNPPDDPTRTLGHASLAWPTAFVSTSDRKPAGYLMPKLEADTSIPILRVTIPRNRFRFAANFTWEYLLRSARNLSSAVAAMHDRGYVIGDVNESNIFVANTALVTVIDCDSAQVPAGNGVVYRCLVAKPDYLAPELHGVRFDQVDREPSADAFALAVLLFQLLMEGAHPYAGVWHGYGETPDTMELIAKGYSPHVPGNESVITPSPVVLPFATVPPPLQQLFRQCFGPGHRNPAARPTAREWRDGLARAETLLTKCSVNRQHVYSGHLASCPWCERVAKGLSDPFPPLASITSQQPLPAVPLSRPTPQPVAPSAPPRSSSPAVTPTMPTRPQTTPSPVRSAPTVLPPRAAYRGKGGRRSRLMALYLVLVLGGIVGIIAFVNRGSGNNATLAARATATASPSPRPSPTEAPTVVVASSDTLRITRRAGNQGNRGINPNAPDVIKALYNALLNDPIGASSLPAGLHTGEILEDSRGTWAAEPRFIGAIQLSMDGDESGKETGGILRYIFYNDDTLQKNELDSLYNELFTTENEDKNSVFTPTNANYQMQCHETIPSDYMPSTECITAIGKVVIVVTIQNSRRTRDDAVTLTSLAAAQSQRLLKAQNLPTVVPELPPTRLQEVSPQSQLADRIQAAHWPNLKEQFSPSSVVRSRSTSGPFKLMPDLPSTVYSKSYQVHYTPLVSAYDVKVFVFRSVNDAQAYFSALPRKTGETFVSQPSRKLEGYDYRCDVYDVKTFFDLMCSAIYGEIMVECSGPSDAGNTSSRKIEKTVSTGMQGCEEIVSAAIRHIEPARAR